MSKSVVIFGMAHSGKSTLMGFLIAEEKKINIDEYEQKLMRMYGTHYDSKQIYAYIVDTNRDEIKRINSKSGNTKSLHFNKININNIPITIIDTLGAEHKDKERSKGMFYSDIGVFCIELSQVIDDTFYNNNRINYIISQLMLWTHFKKDVIILLTKSDVISYGEEDYLLAKEKICDLCEMVNLNANIIPVAINVRTRNSHNVLALSSTKMPWYNGESFYSILNEKLNNIVDNKSNNLLFYIDRQYKKSNSYTGKSWRIKVLTGNLNRGDRVVFAPVKKDDKMVSISCKIKTIRYDINKNEEIEELETVSAGNFVGIDICDIKLNNKTISKDDFDAIRTTCGFSARNNYIIGEYAIVEISKEHSNLFITGSVMKLMWFGRTVGVKIISSTIENSKIKILFKMESKALALPLIDNKVIFDSVVIDTCTQKYKDNLTRAQNTFIDATLIELRENL